jgi:Tfp pilus assembly protein PilO
VKITPIALGVTAVVALGWGLLAAKPEYENLQASKDALTSAQDTLSRDQAEAASLGSEQKRATALNDRASQLNATLPDREGLFTVLQDLRVMADARHVDVSSITRAAAVSPTPGIAAITLNVTGKGKYPDVQRLLNDLHSTTRAMTTDSGTFTAAADGLTTNLKLITYARNLPVVAAPPCPAPGATPSPTTPAAGTTAATPPANCPPAGTLTPPGTTPPTVTPGART